MQKTSQFLFPKQINLLSQRWDSPVLSSSIVTIQAFILYSSLHCLKVIICFFYWFCACVSVFLDTHYRNDVVHSSFKEHSLPLTCIYHSFRKHLLRVYNVFGAGNRRMNQTLSLTLLLGREHDVINRLWTLKQTY